MIIEIKNTVPDVIVNDTHYTYDPLGQLIKEVHNNVTVNEMTYDNLGNIKKKNGVTYTYSTGAWKDQLTGVGSKSITYDAQGNPLNYLGHTLTWEKGRQLKKFDANTYTYNANGIRSGKNVNGTAHSYRLDGTKILSEKWGANTLIPLYNNDDEVCGIKYNGTTYYFLKNLQGDVISITDSRGRCVAEYTYDAWGECKKVSDTTVEKIASINPFRYRSYYYDSETGLYYLQSRYYDPAVGRFVNSDQPELLKFITDMMDCNLYTYCGNDASNNFDVDGNFSLKGIFKTLKEIISFSWKGIKIKLSRTVTVIVGVLSLILRIFSVVSDIKSIHKFLGDKLATAIVTAIPYNTSYLTSEVIAFVCDVGAVVAMMSAILTFFMNCCTGAVFQFAKIAFDFVVSYICPTIIDSVRMLYYGFKKNKGCIYTLKFLGGASVSF